MNHQQIYALQRQKKFNIYKAAKVFQAPVKKTGVPGTAFYGLSSCNVTEPGSRGKVVYLLTLQQLKQIVDVPVPERRSQTMRRLKESGKAVIHEKFDGNTEITVYKNGYVLYRVGCAATVFSVHSCGEYLYHASDKPYKIDGSMFEQEAKQWRNTVHYQFVPEECRSEVNEEDSVLARVIQEETITELMEVLTEQQRDVIRRFFLYQKSQKQIAGELGVSMPAVSQKLSRAIQRIQRKKRPSTVWQK